MSLQTEKTSKADTYQAHASTYWLLTWTSSLACGNGLCHEKDEERQRPLGALGTPKILQEFAWLKRVT